MTAASIYRTLLRLYPRDHRALFADEMANAFDEGAGDKQGIDYFRFALVECAGLLAGAGAEWIAKFSTDPSVRGRTMPDRVRMRPAGVPWETYYAGAYPDTQPDEVAEAEKHTEALVGRLVHAIAHHDFERARAYARQEQEARETLQALREKHGISD